MLDKKIQKPDFIGLDFGELALDCGGYEVATARFGGECEGLLKPRHCRLVLGWRGGSEVWEVG